MLLPSVLLSLLSLALPALSHASPQPPLISSDYEMSLVPRHTLFLRQISNLQTFEGQLGGVAASPITNSGDAKRPFSVDGDTFDSFESAAQRSCDNQFNKCGDAANGNGNNNNNDRKERERGGDRDGNGNDEKKKKGKRQDGGLSVQACDEQKSKFFPLPRGI
jgi:hypothetical protein